MPKKRVVLSFPKNLVDQPIIYKLVKEFNLVINILRAQIMPDKEGKLVLELDGSKADIEKGLDYIKSLSVNIDLLGKDINIDYHSCVNCGACTAVCLSRALTINPETYKLEFDRTKCVLCGLCVGACPVKAIEVVFE